MKILKKIGKWLLFILVFLNLAILISGKTYLYKGIWNTYLKGRSGPSIEEYTIFENRTIKAGEEILGKISGDKIKIHIFNNYNDYNSNNI